MRPKCRILGGGAINAITFTFIFVLIATSLLYFPVAVKGMHLDEVMGEVTLQGNKMDNQEMIDLLLDQAERKHDIILFEEDIEIERTSKFLQMFVTWRPIIYIPLIGKEIELEKDYVKERVIL